ncbi:MAG TPA: type II 3-dehydroquinate dehydratase [Clostridiales bacterium]|nr:type II 3-dehydroquinate dehydratase [Clostridiales bacterium]
MKILVINGPNLNFIGIREKEIYGDQDYNYLVKTLNDKAKLKEIDLDLFQSNIEGEIINKIQKAYKDSIDGIVINPGAFTHYSYAIRDALASIKCRKIEVHITNVYKREEFRQKSVIAPVCDGQITGLGLQGYYLAIEAIINMVNSGEAKEFV